MNNFIDLFLLLAFVWGAWQGYRKGLIVEFAGMIVLVLSLYFGLKGMNWAAGLIQTYLGIQSVWLPLMGFLLVFIGSMILVKFLAGMLEQFVRTLLPAWLSQVFGAILGSARWLLWVSLLLWVFSASGLIPQQYRLESWAYKFSHLYAEAVIGLMKSIFGDLGNLFHSTAPQ
jgi:membrane protein required for colicin V production